MLRRADVVLGDVQKNGGIKCVFPTLSYLSAWEDASITIWERPASTALRIWRHSSRDSGVVSVDASLVFPS